MTTTNEADELTARAVSCPCQTRRIHARTASAVGFAPWRGMIPTLGRHGRCCGLSIRK